MGSKASLRIKTIRRDQKRPKRMKRPELLFRAFHSFGPYCRGLEGDSPPPAAGGTAFHFITSIR